MSLKVLPVHELNGNKYYTLNKTLPTCVYISRNYRFLMVYNLHWPHRFLLDLYAKTGGERMKRLTQSEKFPGGSILRKKSSPVLFGRGRGGEEWTRCNRERTIIEFSSSRVHRFMFRISSFLEVALINRFQVASKWRPSLMPSIRARTTWIESLSNVPKDKALIFDLERKREN